MMKHTFLYKIFKYSNIKIKLIYLFDILNMINYYYTIYVYKYIKYYYVNKIY